MYILCIWVDDCKWAIKIQYLQYKLHCMKIAKKNTRIRQ